MMEGEAVISAARREAERGTERGQKEWRMTPRDRTKWEDRRAVEQTKGKGGREIGGEEQGQVGIQKREKDRNRDTMTERVTEAAILQERRVKTKAVQIRKTQRRRDKEEGEERAEKQPHEWSSF